MSDILLAVDKFTQTLSRFLKRLEIYSLNPDYFYLKAYAPGLYGYLLIFDSEGNLLGAVNPDGGEILESFIREEALKEKYLREEGISYVSEFLLTLSEKGIVQKGRSLPSLKWIDPKDHSLCQTSIEISKFDSKFYNYLATIFHTNTPLIDTYPQFSAHILKYLSQTMAGRASLGIDIGCGSGRYSSLMEQHGITTISTDASFERLKLAKEKIFKNAYAVVCRSEALPFKTGVFDFSLCLFLLEHVTDLSGSIKEMIRVAKSGGRLLIAIPSFSIASIISDIGKKVFLDLGHRRAFGLFQFSAPWCISTRKLIKKIKKAGVSIEIIEGINVINSPGKGRFVRKIYRYVNKTFTKIFPFKYLGEQTLILCKKR